MAEDKAKLRQELDNLEDAEQEIMLADGGDEDGACLSIGGTFIVAEEDDVDDFINSMRDRATAEFEKLNDQMEQLTRRQSELKSLLYARFGKNINLEL